MRAIKTFHAHRLAAGSLVVLAVLLAAPVTLAGVRTPYDVGGQVRVNGQPVGGGTMIRAWCSGVEAAHFPTEVIDEMSWYSLQVEGDDPATPAKEGCTDVPAPETITFTIGQLSAEQTTPWVEGGQLRLDLTAVTAKANPVVTLEIHNSDEVPVTRVPPGTSVHGSTTVTSNAIVAPTGSVNFTFYSNGTCSGAGIPSGTLPLVGNLAHPSLPQTPPNPGEYAFKAHYLGDVNHNPSDSACKVLTVEMRHGYLPLVLRR